MCYAVSTRLCTCDGVAWQACPFSVFKTLDYFFFHWQLRMMLFYKDQADCLSPPHRSLVRTLWRDLDDVVSQAW